jgi:hypothetical protein
MDPGEAMTIRGVLRRIRRVYYEARERSFQTDMLRRYRGDFGPQLFILGLPRSGTTLVYQYIVHRLHVSYFTNGVGTHPYDPVRETCRQLRHNAPYRSDFASEFGRSSGAMAPREAGNFWLRFFDIDAYETRRDVSRRDAETLRVTVRALQTLFGGAVFVNKNVKHMLRIDALAAIFDDAHFLVVDRDMVDVALSVLRAREKTLGSSEAWFSARPPNYDELARLDPVGQVCGQVFALDRRMRDDLDRVDADRVHNVSYDAFCDRPDTVVDSCASLVGGVDEKNPAVERFELRRSRPETEMEEALVAAVRTRQAETGDGGKQ